MSEMRISRAYKTELAPNGEQLKALARQAGAVRFVYNWGLAQKIAARERGEKVPSGKTLDNHLRALKDSNPDFAWLNEVASHPRQAALANVDTAFKNFFDRLKKGKRGKSAGFPKFKSRKRGDTVGIRHFSYRITETHLHIARVGTIKLKEKGYMPVGKYGAQADGSRLMGVTITERAGRWFASIQVEMDAAEVDAPNRATIGVDVGIKSLAVVSDGRTFANPKSTARFARKLRRAQKQLSRRVKGSKNREKARRNVARIHYQLACVRSDAIHKATTAITQNPSVIAVESLNVSGMTRNRRLAKAVSDASMSEFLRQVKYKAAWRGSVIVEADKWMPSSKTCSCCGWRNDALTLSDRTFVCGNCGMELDRDLNAARNLAKLAASYAERLNACGDGSSACASALVQPVDETGIHTPGGDTFVECH